MARKLKIKDLREAAHKIQRTLCVYDLYRSDPSRNPAEMCDCKYGCSNIAKGTETGNGCPEMRDILGVLRELKQSELDMLVKRFANKRHNSQ